MRFPFGGWKAIGRTDQIDRRYQIILINLYINNTGVPDLIV